MTLTAEKPGFVVRRGEDGGEARLAMQELLLGGTLTPLGARLVVRHVFRSAERKPLELVYAFILPRDAQLRRFTVTGEGFSVESDLKPVEEACADYEAALAQGSLAAIAQSCADGYANLSVGNVRPGETVTVHLELLAGVEALDDGFRFRFPFTVAPAYHAQARYGVNDAGEGEVEPPQAVFGDMLLPPVRAAADGLHSVGFDLCVAATGEGASVASPSHALRVGPAAGGGLAVALGRAGDVPDRDLVLEVRTPHPGATVLAGTDASGRRQIGAVMPSSLFPQPAVPASAATVFLLDRSGSMDGACLQQAKRALRACLGALGPQDHFALVTFATDVATLAGDLIPATAGNRRLAEGFLDATRAGGGTELGEALTAAARFCAGTPRPDIFLVTDGEVMETAPVLQFVKGLGCRLHVLGIGSASQDRFLVQLARGSGGLSRYVTPDERVDVAALTLFTDSRSVLAEQPRIEVVGDPQALLAPEPPAAVCAGQPVVVHAETAATVGVALHISWEKPVPGSVEVPVPAGETAGGFGETLRLLRGARLITDLEAGSGVGPEAGSGPIFRRAGRRAEQALVRLGQEYGLANRCLALVAVVKRAGDRPGKVPATRVVPVGMPHGKGFGAYFDQGFDACDVQGPPGAAPASVMCSCSWSAVVNAPPTLSGLARRAAAGARALMGPSAPPPAASAPADDDTRLLEWVADLEPDGGMPGDTAEARAAHSAMLLLLLLAAGHSERRGPFRTHVRRLRVFLEQAAADQALPAAARRTLARVLGCAATPRWTPDAACRAALVRWRDGQGLAAPAEQWALLAALQEGGAST